MTESQEYYFSWDDVISSLGGIFASFTNFVGRFATLWLIKYVIEMVWMNKRKAAYQIKKIKIDSMMEKLPKAITKLRELIAKAATKEDNPHF